MVRIGFVGAGKVGKAFSKYLYDSGITITGFYSRTSPDEIAEQVEGTVFSSVDEVIEKSDIIFLTVPDDVIETVAEGVMTENLSGKVIAHCSGCLGSGILSSLEQRGALTASMHPIMAFGGDVDLARTLFTVEGMGVTELKKLPVKAVDIAPEKKILYHAALCQASNHIVTLLSLAGDMLDSIGLPVEIAEPLTQNAVKQFYQKGSGCLTGPVSRGDINTINKQLSELPDEFLEEYKMYVKFTVDLAYKLDRIDNNTVLKFKKTLN